MWNSRWMKTLGKFIVAAFLVVGIFLLLNSGGSNTSVHEASGGASSDPSLSKVALDVATIRCSGCQSRVETSAGSVPGVKEVKFATKRVFITYDPTQATPDAIVEAVNRGGDKVTKVTNL